MFDDFILDKTLIPQVQFKITVLTKRQGQVDEYPESGQVPRPSLPRYFFTLLVLYGQWVTGPVPSFLTRMRSI